MVVIRSRTSGGGNGGGYFKLALSINDPHVNATANHLKFKLFVVLRIVNLLLVLS